MKTIWIKTEKNGEVVLYNYFKEGVTLDEACELAECEVNAGYADYARITVNGDVYMEYEA